MTHRKPRHAESTVRHARGRVLDGDSVRRPGALLAAAALLLGACSASVAADDEAGDPVEVSTAADVIPWGDDNAHLVVATVNGPGTSTTDAGATSIDGSDEPGAGASTTLLLETPSGSRVLDGPPPGLLPVEPIGPVEVAAVAAEPGNFIAVDVDGVIGVPGARYLRTLTTLRALDGDTPVSVGTGSDGIEGDEVFAELDEVATGFDAAAIVEAVSPTRDAIAVQVVDGQSDEAIVEQIAALDGVVDAEIVGPGIIAVSVDAESDDTDSPAVIAEIAGVSSVNDDLLAYVYDDARQGEQWAIENTGRPEQAAGWPGVAGADIRADEAWNVTTGAGVIVAVIDSGQDLNHRDLAANTWSNPADPCGNGIDDDANGYVDDCRGWDFGAGDNNPTFPPSSNGTHGTHVAGIIAAARNGVGVVGAMPDATLMVLKVAQENGAIPMSAVAAAINYAADNGADVVNLSLGTAPGTSLGTNSTTELAIRHARDRGVTVVVASGNDSANLDARGPGWPAGFAATYDNVLTVGASTNSDTHAYFSNTGRVVGLHAPGWAVLSTMPGSTEDMKWGTSMAAPYAAAGAAAVIASGQATAPVDVIARLRSTATDLGWGRRLDIAAAVGYEPPLEGADLDVVVSGADRVVADTPAALDWTIQAPDTTAATGIRLSVAARHDGVISAVDGLEITFADAGGHLGASVSNDVGEFPVVPIRDAAALIGEGLRLNASMTLPATEYAFVVELVDESGTALSAPHATYVSVPAEAVTNPGGPTTEPGSTTTTVVPVTPPLTTPPTTTPPTTAPATTVPATTTQPTPTTVPAPTGPTTTAPSNGGSTPTAPVGPTTTTSTTTVPSGGGGQAPTTTTPASGSQPTTTAPGNSGGTGQPPTVTPPPTTAAPAPTTTAPAGPGTAPATTTPVVSTTTVPAGPPPTDPTPDPTRDGVYRIESVSPASGPIDGFTRVAITGEFPTVVPVYVWFGDQPTAVVRAATSPNLLTVDTPPVDRVGSRDVVVKFATTRSYELRLAGAFDYTPSSIGGPTTTTTVPSTTAPTSPPVTGPPPSGGATTTTTIAGGTTPTPITTTTTTSTTTTTTTTTVPSSPITTTTVPPSNGGGPTNPPQDRQLGGLTLRRQPTAGALSRLTTAAWPAPGCHAEVCAATRL